MEKLVQPSDFKVLEVFKPYIDSSGNVREDWSDRLPRSVYIVVEGHDRCMVFEGTVITKLSASYSGEEDIREFISTVVSRNTAYVHPNVDTSIDTVVDVYRESFAKGRKGIINVVDLLSVTHNEFIPTENVEFTVAATNAMDFYTEVFKQRNEAALKEEFGAMDRALSEAYFDPSTPEGFRRLVTDSPVSVYHGARESMLRALGTILGGSREQEFITLDQYRVA